MMLGSVVGKAPVFPHPSCSRPAGAELGAKRSWAPYQMPSEKPRVCLVGGVFGTFLGLFFPSFYMYKPTSQQIWSQIRRHYFQIRAKIPMRSDFFNASCVVFFTGHFVLMWTWIQTHLPHRHTSDFPLCRRSCWDRQKKNNCDPDT